MKDKKCNVACVLKKVLIGAGSFALVNMVGGFISGFANMKKVKEHENGNNFMQTSIFGKVKIDIKEDTQYSFISCWSGCVDLVVEKPVNDSVDLDILSVFGKVNLYLPEGVKVNIKESGACRKLENNADTCELEDAPVINIVSRGFASKVILSTR